MTVPSSPLPDPGSLAVWWRAVRPASFTASVTPVLIGAAAAAYDGVTFSSALLLVTLVAAVAIHAATNLVNDYYDHIRGVDQPDSPGPSGVIQHGLLAPRVVLSGSLALFGLGSVLGLWLVVIRGWPILALGVLSVLAGYGYTGGPLPLGYVGVGDLVVFSFMGMGTVLGSYFVLTARLSATPVWAALPVAALVTAILVVNNLRDLSEDRAGGKRTLATYLGPAATRLEFLALVITAYVAAITGIFAGALPYQTAVVLLTVPRAVRVWTVIRSETDRSNLTTRGLRGTAQLHLRFGLLLAAALLISR